MTGQPSDETRQLLQAIGQMENLCINVWHGNIIETMCGIIDRSRTLFRGRGQARPGNPLGPVLAPAIQCVNC